MKRFKLILKSCFLIGLYFNIAFAVEPNSESTFFPLPLEMILKILEELDPRDLGNFSVVSKRTNEISKNITRKPEFHYRLLRSAAVDILNIENSTENTEQVLSKAHQFSKVVHFLNRILKSNKEGLALSWDKLLSWQEKGYENKTLFYRVKEAVSYLDKKIGSSELRMGARKELYRIIINLPVDVKVFIETPGVFKFLQDSLNSELKGISKRFQYQAYTWKNLNFLESILWRELENSIVKARKTASNESIFRRALITDKAIRHLVWIESFRRKWPTIAGYSRPLEQISKILNPKFLDPRYAFVLEVYRLMEPLTSMALLPSNWPWVSSEFKETLAKAQLISKNLNDGNEFVFRVFYFLIDPALECMKRSQYLFPFRYLGQAILSLDSEYLINQLFKRTESFLARFENDEKLSYKSILEGFLVDPLYPISEIGKSALEAELLRISNQEDLISEMGR